MVDSKRKVVRFYCTRCKRFHRFISLARIDGMQFFVSEEGCTKIVDRWT